MARQQVNVRLSSYTVGQLKELARRFDMSESTVIMLAIDRLARDTKQGEGILSGESEEEGADPEPGKKGGQTDGKVRKEARARRRHNP
jgi:predicted transcriptional regulator